MDEAPASGNPTATELLVELHQWALDACRQGTGVEPLSSPGWHMYLSVWEEAGELLPRVGRFLEAATADESGDAVAQWYRDELARLDRSARERHAAVFDELLDTKLALLTATDELAVARRHLSEVMGGGGSLLPRQAALAYLATLAEGSET